MSFFMPDPINPRFVTWFGNCPADAQVAILAFWAESETHPDLSPHGGSSVEYARKYRTLQFCAEHYGYSFP